MKRYLLLHYGFEKPTPEIMQAWKTWFQSVGDRQVDQGGFHAGACEITRDGVRDLPMGSDSITGYSIIEADSFDAAKAIAAENPFIAGIRVYEIVEH